MRLRDLGGLVVIDFIDMGSGKHQRAVEDRLQHALKQDRARVQIGKISRFGLLELSRQRLRPSLGESSQIVCPRCDGHGRMRSVESLSLSIIRLAEEHAMKDNTAQVLIQAPPEIANYLLNEKRRALVEIETRHDAPIIVVADDQLETPHFNVSRLRDGETGEEVAKPSYHRTSPRKLEVHALTKAHINVPDLPAVTHVAPAQPAPTREIREEVVAVSDAPIRAVAAPASGGFFGWLKSMFSSSASAAPAPADRPRSDRPDRNDRGDRDRGDRGGSRGNDARRGGRGGQPQGSRSAGGGNRQQASAKTQQAAAKPVEAQAAQSAKGQPRGEPRPERSEEQKLLDEQRRLEQQKKEVERRELQRQENIKRETERRAAREARLAAQAAETGGEVMDATGETNADAAIDDALVTADGSAATPEGSEAAAGEGGRRRRGRRGGRRRRRQDGTVVGEVAGTEDGSSSQSEIDFDDEEEGEGQESFETSSTSPVASSAPVLASAFTVTSAESDFDDLPMTEEVVAAPVPAFVAPVQSIVAPVQSFSAPVEEVEAVAAPVQVVAMQAPEPEVAAPIANVAPLSTPSVSEVYALPAEPAPVQPSANADLRDRAFRSYDDDHFHPIERGFAENADVRNIARRVEIADVFLGRSRRVRLADARAHVGEDFLPRNRFRSDELNVDGFNNRHPGVLRLCGWHGCDECSETPKGHDEDTELHWLVGVLSGKTSPPPKLRY